MSLAFEVQDAVHDAWIDVMDLRDIDDHINVKQEMFERIEEIFAEYQCHTLIAQVKEIGWHIAFDLDTNSWEDYKEARERCIVPDDLSNPLVAESMTGLLGALDITDVLDHHKSDVPVPKRGNPIWCHNMKCP